MQLSLHFSWPLGRCCDSCLVCQFGGKARPWYTVRVPYFFVLFQLTCVHRKVKSFGNLVFHSFL
uniref:Uncharacterized protein n=1 Tax=Anguilla anguilla TaxID=7936 RepID=A0A0E9S744_ANGAN